jgi:E3 ubiquitin-protein ligase UBR1
MIAQIRTGLWVRNGFAIRGQLLHYRDYMLRELCYDQDLYILQTSLVLIDPNTIFVTTLDRFGLLNYFSGSPSSPTNAGGHPVFEPQQLSSMVEELLYVLIVILSEDASPQHMSVESAVRREIVHALSMGPCTFSDLVKRVAERLVDDVSFERKLTDVANFKPPETATDSGLYELKDEVYDEVNPFFYHYTRNKREEVENALKVRLRKKTGESDPVIVPRKLGVEEDDGTGKGELFGKLTESFEKEVLIQIMFYSLENVLAATDSSGVTPPSAEAILDQALHLVMLGIVEREGRFARLAASLVFNPAGPNVTRGEGDSEMQGAGARATGKTLLDVICTLEHHDKYKLYNSRVVWILAELEKHIPGEVVRRRVVPDRTSAPQISAEDAKKRAAKARQEAIMQQIKAQQVSFATNLDDIGDGEDDIMEEDGDENEQVSFGTCIVCQEDLNSSRGFGALSLIQPSRLLRKQPDIPSSYLNEVLTMRPSLDRASPPPPPAKFPPDQKEVLGSSKQSLAPNFEGFPSSYTKFGLHGSVCTHMMHLECFQVYSISIRQRHRAQATRNHPENIPRKEYICPLCKSLGNVILPVTNPSRTVLNTEPFADWIRAAGISILKSKPDPLMDALQFKNGTGEFVFWGVQDPGYALALRNPDRWGDMDTAKMLDTLMSVCKSFSQQTRHLRDRPEPEAGDRGAGIYLPEELIGYTIAGIEVAQRGLNVEDGGLVADNLTEAQMRMIRGLLVCLSRLSAMQFKGRPNEGRDAIRQAIIKRLLPEWSRITLTSFSYPLLLRDPFTILVETAAVAPEMIKHILILTYYACLARTVIGLIYILTKTRSFNTPYIANRSHEEVFGDVRMFFMSVVRHSPIFEHTAMLAFETFGEARIEKLLYQFTLPFLRRAAIICRSILPSAFPTPMLHNTSQEDEYKRLLDMLGIPPLADLPNQDTLQNALSGWCAHYGHSQAASQLNCGVVLEYPTVYRMARLPVVLDSLFGQQDKALTCQRCNTVPMDAAICLVCGATCCFQSYCCTDIDYNERGECNMHTRE